MSETSSPQLKKTTYTEAQKRAIQKYRQTHREKVNEISRKQYHQNEDMRERKLAKSKIYNKIWKEKQKTLQEEFCRLSLITGAQ